VTRRWPVTRRLVAEVCLVLVVGGLVVGAIVGTGLAKTAVDTPNPFTWFANLRGQVVQVHPDSGPMTKLRIGAPSDALEVRQDGTRLVVYDRTTNKVTVIDLATLSVSGQRQGLAGGRGFKVLLGHQIYLVDFDTATLLAVDPLTAGTVGAWRAGDVALVDAALGGDGTQLYLLDRQGVLSTVAWTGSGFVLRERRQVSGAGEHAVLVGTTGGVAVLDGQSGVVALFDAGGQNRTEVVPALHGTLTVPPASPSSLVPVAAPAAGAVVLVRPDRTVTVSLSGYGCSPGELVVFRDRVYLACQGAGKVLVLDRDGRQAQQPIPAPPGPIHLVVNAGLLFIDSPQATTAVVVELDGSTHTVRTDDPTLAVRDPNAQPTTVPSGVQPTPDRTGDTGQHTASTPHRGTNLASPRTRRPPTGSPGSTGSPRSTGSPGSPSGSVTGTASASVDPTSTPSPVTTASPVGTADPDGTPSATSSPPPSPAFSPTPGPPTTAPTADPAALAPTSVTAVALPSGQVSVGWTAPSGGTPTGYGIIRTDTGEVVGQQPAGQTSASITTIPPRTTTAFVVRALYPSASYSSPPSPPVTTVGQPGAPGNIQVRVTARTPAALSLSVGFDTPPAGDLVTSYDLTVDGNFPTAPVRANGVSTSDNPHTVNISCDGGAPLCTSGGTITVTVQFGSAAGTGPPGQQSVDIPAAPAGVPGQVLVIAPGGNCLDMPSASNGASLQLSPCDGRPSERWNLGGSGAELQGQGGKCADVDNEGSNAGDRVQAYDCNNGNNQRWDFVNQISGDQWSLKRHNSSNECLRPVGGGTGVGTPIEINGCATIWTFFSTTALVAQRSAVPAGSVQTVLVASSDSLGAPAAGAIVAIPLLLAAARGTARRRREKR
jgi:hypothetical protein